MTFVKGQSGNPGGRPKLPWTFQSIYKAELEKEIESGGQRVEAKQVVATKIVELATKGDLDAIKELANRIDGLSPQKIQLSHPEDEKTDEEIEKELEELKAKRHSNSCTIPDCNECHIMLASHKH